MPRGAWSGFAGKKYFIIGTILLLAAGCGKPAPGPDVSNQTPQAASQPSAVPANSATSTPPPASAAPSAFVPKPAPLALAVYKDPNNLFSINYTSDFKLFSAASLSAKTAQSENTAGCNVPGPEPSVCFVLKGAPYKPSNLSSAASSIKIRTDKASLTDCAAFPASELGFGHLGNPAMINGTVFVTATSDNAAAGTETQVRMNRAFYRGACYEVDESLSWTNAQNFSPPRQEVNKEEVWAKLDAMRGNFRFGQ